MRGPASVAIGLTAGGMAYLAFGRRRVLNWGATESESSSELPGDELLTAVAIQTTRATTVHAAPEAIWPWLVQMGPKPRAGVYTYDWLERRLGIDIENGNRILPEYQELAVGTVFRLSPESETGLVVREVLPARALVLQWTPANSTWAFVLDPQPDGTTRLISRNRIPGSGWRFWAGMVLFMEVGSLVMERKMLSGIRQRAERQPPSGSTAGA